MKSTKNRKLLREAYGDESLEYLEGVRNQIQSGLLSYFHSVGGMDDFLITNMKEIIGADVERRIDELFFGGEMNRKFTEIRGVYRAEEPFGLRDKLRTFDWTEVRDKLAGNGFYVGDNVSYDVATTFKIGKLFEPREMGPEMIALISEVYKDNIDSQIYGTKPMERFYYVLENTPRIPLDEIVRLAEVALCSKTKGNAERRSE